MSDQEDVRARAGFAALPRLVEDLMKDRPGSYEQLLDWYVAANAVLVDRVAAGRLSALECADLRAEIHTAFAGVPGLQLVSNEGADVTGAVSGTQPVDLRARDLGGAVSLLEVDAELWARCVALVQQALVRELGFSSSQAAVHVRQELDLVVLRDSDGARWLSFRLPVWSSGTRYRSPWTREDLQIAHMARQAAYHLAGRDDPYDVLGAREGDPS